MKTLFPIPFLIVLCNYANAQAFEGSVTWDRQEEFLDPGVQARVDKLNKKRTQVGGHIDFMPLSFVLKLKGDAVIAQGTYPEGDSAGDQYTLYLPGKTQGYLVDRKEKTYMAIPMAETQKAPKVTKTGATREIQGYQCVNYRLEYKGKSARVESYWTTTEIKGLDWKRLARFRKAFASEYVDGLPLRIETAGVDGTGVMEVSAIQTTELNPADFTIPEDFKQVDWGK